eukprot:gene10040-12739_t
MREVLIALNSVTRGRIYHPPVIENGEQPTTVVRSADSISKLTPKEYEVLRHFVRGESMTQIAENLKRSRVIKR